MVLLSHGPLIYAAAPTPTMIRREFRFEDERWGNVDFGDEVGGFELWFILEYQAIYEICKGFHIKLS